MTEPPKVLIVIVNWNGYRDTVELLHSLSLVTYKPYDILVIDNGSLADEAAMLKKNFPYITTIRNKQNLGYAGGNNTAIPYAYKNGYDIIAILNNDLTVEKGFLEPLVTALQTKPEVGLTCAVVRNFQKKEFIQSAGGIIHVATGTVRLLHSIPKNSTVDFAPGACFCIRTSLLSKLNGFDEHFFAYWEECDLAMRARRLGFHARLATNSTVFHKTASSSKYLSRTYVYFMLRNQLYFMRKHCPWFLRPLYLLFFFFRNVLGYFFVSVIRKSPGYRTIPRAIADGFTKSLSTSSDQ